MDKIVVERKGYHRRGYRRKDGTQVEAATVRSSTFDIEDRGQPGRTPESEQFYHPKVHTGWHKDMPERKRRELVLNAHKGDYTASGRAMQALANVTTDRETKRAAREDAVWFFQQSRMRSLRISPKVLRVSPRMPRLR